ncbi:MAG TPA: energy transducer TonB [Vicinamibacterales bacterium]|nr:energy transducer TonB [Vicinamibacterales bacterium]
MVNKLTSSLLLFTLIVAPVAFADEAEIVKGLQNIARMHGAAEAIEIMRVTEGGPPPLLPRDPWGTPYRVEVSPTDYRIISAGSDLKFAAETWGVSEQFTGLEGDVVLMNGRMFRSNRNWLYGQVAPGGASAAALEELRDAELRFMTTRDPLAQALLIARLTAMSMEGLGVLIEKHRTAKGSLAELAPPSDAMAIVMEGVKVDPRLLTRDAWGTPLHLLIAGETYRIVSAGADKTFDEASWGRPPGADTKEDIIYDNGKFTRRFDEKEVLRAARLQAVPLPQPLERPIDIAGRFARVGGDVKAPVVTNRVEPVYPEDYRRARLSGIVILEAALSETGTVEDVRVIKSLAPEFDMAAVKALRQWTFRPGMLAEKPIPVLYNLTVNFKLQ